MALANGFLYGFSPVALFLITYKTVLISAYEATTGNDHPQVDTNDTPSITLGDTTALYEEPNKWIRKLPGDSSLKYCTCYATEEFRNFRGLLPFSQGMTDNLEALTISIY